jgi:hypothetical protein
MPDTLITIREVILGEIRHRIVKRIRDMTYWKIKEYRNEEGRWCPMTVSNQSGRQTDAERRFAEETA